MDLNNNDYENSLDIDEQIGSPPSAPIDAPPAPTVHPIEIAIPKFRYYSTNKTACNICFRRYNTIDDIHMHYLQMHPDRALSYCEVCAKPYLIVDSLRKHRARKHELKNFRAANYRRSLNLAGQ